jgi:hypothetical protein
MDRSRYASNLADDQSSIVEQAWIGRRQPRMGRQLIALWRRYRTAPRAAPLSGNPVSLPQLEVPKQSSGWLLRDPRASLLLQRWRGCGWHGPDARLPPMKELKDKNTFCGAAFPGFGCVLTGPVARSVQSSLCAELTLLCGSRTILQSVTVTGQNCLCASRVGTVVRNQRFDCSNGG